MGVSEEKRAVYAEIMEILLHRSGQIYTISVEVLKDQYLPTKDPDFVDACVRDLDVGDYPVSCSGSEVVELVDKDEAKERIADIRSDLYGLDM